MMQLTHKINRLAYGDYFPGVVNPLDGYYVYIFCYFHLIDVLLKSIGWFANIYVI